MQQAASRASNRPRWTTSEIDARMQVCVLRGKCVKNFDCASDLNAVFIFWFLLGRKYRFWDVEATSGLADRLTLVG